MKASRTPRVISLLCSLFAAACAALFVAQVSAADLPREHLTLDLNWKFHLGDDWPGAARWDQVGISSGAIAPRFNDSAWDSVNLPHDWAVELQFDPAAGCNTREKI